MRPIIRPRDIPKRTVIARPKKDNCVDSEATFSPTAPQIPTAMSKPYHPEKLFVVYTPIPPDFL
jgi:hypothetical protein